MHHDITKKIFFNILKRTGFRSNHPEVFLGKWVLKICSKFTGEHPRRSATSIKLLCNFIEITLWHGCSPVNLMHIFRTPFLKNTSGWLPLRIVKKTVLKKNRVIKEIVEYFCSEKIVNKGSSILRRQKLVYQHHQNLSLTYLRN